MTATPAIQPKLPAANPVPCPLCGANNSRPEVQRRATWLRRCNACDMVFAESFAVPDNMYEEAFTSKDHFYSHYGDDIQALVEHKPYHVAWAWRRFYNQVPPSDRLLDIGCAAGVFMAESKKRGWKETEGIEISESSAAMARKLLNVTVHTEPLEKAPVKPGTFSAVTGWEIVEHVNDPKDFVRRIFALLKPGGHIALSTPNWQSRWERATLDPHRAPPYHLTYWTPPTITRLLSEAGFTDVTTARKPFAWDEEVGSIKQLYLPIAILRRVLLGQVGNRLLVVARKP